MRQRIFLSAIAVMLLATSACSDLLDDDSAQVSGEWLIDRSQIFDGGPGKDGIPALTNPPLVEFAAAGYLSDNDLVVLYKNGDDVRIYPHAILNWHEIVNDDVAGDEVTISYCPLTGSAIGHSRALGAGGNLQVTTFGVSGLLYNNNLILYDRLTDSNWSQMQNRCVNGVFAGQELENVVILETRLATARKLYPNARVLSNQTGVYGSNQYDIYPYGSYRSDARLLFPVTHDDRTYPRKERVLGVVVNGQARAYRSPAFADARIVHQQLGGINIIVAGEQSQNYMIAFQAGLSSGESRQFELLDKKQWPDFMRDGEGNIYNIFGEVISGPDEGQRLQPVLNYIAYWFAWAAFYPDTEVFE